MAGTRGLAGRVFTAVAEGDVNVIAIAQGGSERNITFVTREADAPEAMRSTSASARTTTRSQPSTDSTACSISSRCSKGFLKATEWSWPEHRCSPTVHSPG